MKPICPNPACPAGSVVLAGSYTRSSDRAIVRRFRCKCCGKNFSEATGTACFAQKKRLLNPSVLIGLASGMSQNRLAKTLRTTRVTIARKLAFLGEDCARANTALHRERPAAADVQFDELETFEHTKCKPLSVALAVERKTRRILGFRVSSMPAKGPLAKVAVRKYGSRADERRKGLAALFGEIADRCADALELLSDKCPRYAPIVQATLGARPEKTLNYTQVKGARGCSTAQGELKKLGFDPLFSLNHTCAMLRANVNRLFRRTWNTTKKAECLAMHLQIYTFYHNSELIGIKRKTSK